MIDPTDLDSGQKAKPEMNQVSAFSPEPADEVQQEKYLAAIMAGASSSEASEIAGCSPLGIYMTRYADPQFNQMVQMAQLAQREQMQAEAIRKALVASGHVVELTLTDPETGDPILDDEFEPVKGLRLVNSNSSILANLVERLLASSDKPAPPVTVNVAQNNGSHEELVLIDPTEDHND